MATLGVAASVSLAGDVPAGGGASASPAPEPKRRVRGPCGSTTGVRCVLLEMKHRAQGALVENGLFTKDLQKSLESRFEAMLAQRGS